MNIFVAGGTGAVGKRLVSLLVEAGHEVVVLTRDPAKHESLRSAGVRLILGDVFDRNRLFAIMRDARPDVVYHQLTALSDRNFAENSRIRIEGTRNLADAALAAGARRMIAQSIAFAYEPGDGPASEETPLDTEAPMPRGGTVDAVRALERTAAELPEHVILRYGSFYGPDTWYAPDGLFARQAREGEPIATDGVTSFLHVEDAARAAIEALAWPSGPVNVADDEPAVGTVWFPVYARAVGAPEKEILAEGNPWERGASNSKARTEYGWTPLYPSWREGFTKQG